MNTLYTNSLVFCVRRPWKFKKGLKSVSIFEEETGREAVLHFKEVKRGQLKSPETTVSWATCNRCLTDYPNGYFGEGSSVVYCDCGGILTEYTDFKSYYVVSKKTAYKEYKRDDLLFLEKGKLWLP